MKQIGSGIIAAGEPGTSRAVYTFPSVVALADGTLLATTRRGSGKDGADEDIAVFAERGAGWVPHAPLPAAPVLDGRHGSLKLAYLTELAPDRLVAASMWVDRSSHPGAPLFNAETEGCLPMAILVARSENAGRSWTGWQRVALPQDLGPPSLTAPLFRLGNGRLAMSIETNKPYGDTSPWRQRAVLLTSADEGKSWSEPVTSAGDPESRIFNWDLRIAAASDGRVVSFAWTFDREAGVYRNIHRRISQDHGATWSPPEDIGFADQAGRPAILPDGRVVLAWVDRFGSRSIRARLAPAIDATFDAESEVELHALARGGGETGAAAVGEALANMDLWSYGLPSATTLPDGDAMVVFYAGRPDAMDIRWARLRP
ncbi:hypothetical protein DMC47_18050 [Nostoc sp. 3335mG]|nr:hypothetical protein DMC47_18050 [Nostoc sp. 3335mG]